MPKRFTDTDKWDRPWFRNLPNNYKLLWFFVLDKCDISGVWYVDFEMAQFQIGQKIDRKMSETLFEKQIEINGDRWLIRDFIPFQYGALTEANRIFKNVSAKLGAFKEGAYIPHLYPILSPIDGAKDKDKDKDKDGLVVKEGGVGETITPPKDTDSPKPDKPLTDVQRIVLAYKIVTGYPKEDQAWDKLNFARCAKSAKALLEFMGNWGDSVDCVEFVFNRLNSKGLTVTLETIVRHAADFKRDLGEKRQKKEII